MNVKKYLVCTALILIIGLTMVLPAAAAPVSYSVSVSSYDSGGFSSLSASKLSLLNDYSMTKSTQSSYLTGMSAGKTSAIQSIISSGNTPSIGTVSAFSKWSSIQQDEDGSSSAMEFSQSVSVHGEIFTFDFATTFY